jgi:hypothetical protein
LDITFTSKEAAGMTTNERLWFSGQMKAFDDAIAETNEAGLREICESVFLDEKSVDALLAEHFGD